MIYCARITISESRTRHTAKYTRKVSHWCMREYIDDYNVGRMKQRIIDTVNHYTAQGFTCRVAIKVIA